MRKTINPVYLIQGIVMLLAGLFLLWLSATRCYQYYVTPRTLPYLIFAAIMFLAIAAYDFIKIHEVTHVRRYAHLLALLLPLIMLAASTKTLDLWQTPLFPPIQTNMYNDPAYQSEPYTMKAPVYAGKVIHGYDPPNQTITILEAETYFWLIEIYTDPTPFLGYTIHTMGRVMTNTQYLASDCFSPVRKLMTCCVADMFSIGFPCDMH